MGRRRPSRGQDWKKNSFAEWLASFISGFQTPYIQRYDVVWLKHLMQSSLRPLSVKLAGSAIMAWSDWARLTKLIKCFFPSPRDILFLCVLCIGAKGGGAGGRVEAYWQIVLRSTIPYTSNCLLAKLFAESKTFSTSVLAEKGFPLNFLIWNYTQSHIKSRCTWSPTAKQ